jgi:hypothetical protein
VRPATHGDAPLHGHRGVALLELRVPLCAARCVALREAAACRCCVALSAARSVLLLRAAAA